MTERGQQYTLEGIIAGLIVMLGLFLALQATTATPGGGGATDPHAQQQDRALLLDTLNAANDTQLRQAVLFWNDVEGFHCSPDGERYYPGTTDPARCSPRTSDPTHIPPNELGRLFEQRFGEQYSYNVVVHYREGGDRSEQRLVYQGQPGSTAVKARTTVVVTNDQRLYRAGDDLGDPTGAKLADNPGAFYVPPADGDATDDDLYNVLEVEVILWR